MILCCYGFVVKVLVIGCFIGCDLGLGCLFDFDEIVEFVDFFIIVFECVVVMV